MLVPGWSGLVTEFASESPQALEPDPIGVIRSGDGADVDLRINVWVADFGDPDSADEWLIASGISRFPAVEDVLPGALTFAGCLEAATRCSAFANANGFVLGLALSSDDVAVDADTIEALLRALVPEILATLGE